MSTEARIQELGIKLPPAPPKGGIYKPVVVDGSLCEDIFFLCPFCQSHIPIEVDDRTLAYLRR